MNMMLYYFKLFVITFIIFIIIDLTWLGLIMQRYYNNLLGPLARHSQGHLILHWPSAFIAYLFLVSGLIIFVLPRAVAFASRVQAGGYGALFGLIIYGVYEFTNHSLIVGWPVQLVVVDTLWGAVVCGLTTTIMVYIMPLL